MESKGASKEGKAGVKREGQSTEDRMKKIKAGFKITHVDMSDEESGEVMWERSTWDDIFEKEITITIPADILKCAAVARTMKFASKEEITTFRLVQRVMLHGQVLEGTQHRRV